MHNSLPSLRKETVYYDLTSCYRRVMNIENFGDWPHRSNTPLHDPIIGYETRTDSGTAFKRYKSHASQTDGKRGNACYSYAWKLLPPPISSSYLQSSDDLMKKKLVPFRTVDGCPPYSFLSTSLGERDAYRDTDFAPKHISIHPDAIDYQSPIALSSRSKLSSPTSFDGRSAIAFRRNRRNGVSHKKDADATADDNHAQEVKQIPGSIGLLRSKDRHIAVRQKQQKSSPKQVNQTDRLAQSKPEAIYGSEISSCASPMSQLIATDQNYDVSRETTFPTAKTSSSWSNTTILRATQTLLNREPTFCSSPTSYDAPYAVSTAADTIQRSSAAQALQTRNASGSGCCRTTQFSGACDSITQSFTICECCPKKPKRVKTTKEPSAHAAEKQYHCSYCGNRFKSDNEAKRHQNSMHIRQHWWSCSGLNHPYEAFEASITHAGEADICCYCGDRFSRSGLQLDNGVITCGTLHRFATHADWRDRIYHLVKVHKYRECGLSRKFYRADHFRQHLKHSHAGISGKWTNTLENACRFETASAQQ